MFLKKLPFATFDLDLDDFCIHLEENETRFGPTLDFGFSLSLVDKFLVSFGPEFGL
jgi:hypothetical protein